MPRADTDTDTAAAAAAPLAAVAVRVQVPQMLRADCRGAEELSIQAASVRALLAELARRHPGLHRSVCDETGAVRRHVNVFVNATHLRDLEGLDTSLSPGDVLTILPAVSGG